MKIDKLIKKLDKALKRYCSEGTKLAVVSFSHECILLEQRQGDIGEKNLNGDIIAPLSDDVSAALEKHREFIAENARASNSLLAKLKSGGVVEPSTEQQPLRGSVSFPPAGGAEPSREG